MDIVKFVLPKGSLESKTYEIMERAGYSISGQTRTYRPRINDPGIELKILRPQEIPTYISEGLEDVGITGKDWILETNADVETLLDLEYGRIKMVLAVPEQWSEINSLTDLLEKFSNRNKEVRISTEYLNTTAQYVKSNTIYKKIYGNKDPLVITPWWKRGDNPKVNIFLSFGATEAKPPENADAIIDVSETGTTLEQNNLKIIDTILISSAVLIANKKSLDDPLKQDKIYDILALLKGVVDGRKKFHIFVNVREENLKALIKELPSLKGPTISSLSVEGWYSVNTVIDRSLFLELLPKFRRLAQGLVVHEPMQISALEEIKGGNRIGTEKQS